MWRQYPQLAKPGGINESYQLIGEGKKMSCMAAASWHHRRKRKWRINDIRNNVNRVMKIIETMMKYELKKRGEERSGSSEAYV